MAEIRWLPLESNPEVINKYIGALGVESSWQFCDVYGFDSDLLMMVPHPVVAVVLLYPLSEKLHMDTQNEQYRKNVVAECKEIGTVVDPKDLYFIKQTIGNACGTIGLIHSLCNNAHQIKFDELKHLHAFLNATKGMSPVDKGRHLETDTAFGEAHEESALEGQTAAPPRDEKLDLHFVAFVHHEGALYELDGRKDGPTKHGATTPDTLLEDTVKVVQNFMARDPDNLNFTVMTLAKTD